MFEFFFRYPISVFTRGRFVLLGAWPSSLLVASVVLATAGLGTLIWMRLRRLEPVKGVSARTQRARAGTIWALQSALVALLLCLLWQPAILVAELRSQQNIIAVLLDDSRSMAIADSGGSGRETRESAASDLLRTTILSGLQKRFQTRIYRLNGSLKREDAWGPAPAAATATHLGDGLKELASETADLPVGAVVLLSDGAENRGGIDVEAMAALRNRRLPVHTIGFGREHAQHDLELEDVSVTSAAMAESRVRATVSFAQYGLAGARTTLSARDGEKVLAQKEVTLGADGATQQETIFFNAGLAGVRRVTFMLAPVKDEESVANNSQIRLVGVNGARKRILYVEGEPRWEYKFIRRAAEDDKELQVISMLRTTENKIYRQGIAGPAELEAGFPDKAEDLFAYDGIVIGSVEAGYFTPRQQELLREYVDRRGGGLLFLGGRFALGDGGWGASSLSELLPTFLPAGKGTFHREAAFAQLTAAGADSAVMRLVDDPARNVERWKKLPYMMDYQDAGTAKPGATVLAEMAAGRARMPLLVTQQYGRGRTAVLATSGTWRWQMSQALGDPTHDLFWQQLLRWVAADSPGRVIASSSARQLMDDGRVRLTAMVRDKEYVSAPDARVAARLVEPDGASVSVEMAPVPGAPGSFAADWTAGQAGSYVAEITANRGAEELGRDVVTFERQNGVAENFHTGQNRELLTKLSADTGGTYWKASDAGRLPAEISFSEAGISTKNTKELWNMPIVFMALLAFSSGEWMLRRKWGMI